MLSVGAVVDLNDQHFGWRGQYTITKDYGDGKVKIKNNRTNSQQIVSLDRLRLSRLAPFFIKSLQDKQS
jgi:hypothetical protein